jgi:DNA repair protein RecO (recombination protein O)
LFEKEKKEEWILRHFEKALLKSLGYEFMFESHTGDVLEPDCYYHYLPEHGLELVSSKLYMNNKSVFLGQHLLAIAQDDFSDDVILRESKRLFRLALLSLLGNKLLNSHKILLWQD